MRDTPARYCEHCGKAISRGGSSAAKYASRIYCNNACHQAAQAAQSESHRSLRTKACQCCGKTFVRSRQESPGGWRRRVYCGNACKYADRKTRDGTPVDHDSICYCGLPATERVYFLQATALGFASPTHLDVCADCCDLFLETDPGASLSPCHSPRGARLWRNDDTQLPYSPPHGGLANRRTYHD